MRPFLLIALVMAAGCERATTLTSDAGTDAAVIADVGADAGPPDAGCDISPIPSPLPRFTADFAYNDAASGTVVPTMTGGDPTGVWIFDHGTFWVDQQGNSMFNRFGSSVAGTAWIAIDVTDFRLEYIFDATLAGTVIGTVVEASSTRAHARWRLDHEQLEPTGLVCAEATPPMFGDAGRVTFTQTGDHLTLLTVVPMATGVTILQMEGTRVR